VGNGGKTDFVIVLQLLLMSHSEFYYAWRKSPFHADYFDIAYELFMFNKQYIQYFHQENILYELSENIVYKNKYQCEVFKIMFEEWGLNPILNSFYNAKSSKIFDKLNKFETLKRNSHIYSSFKEDEEWELVLDDFLSKECIRIGAKLVINSPWCKLISKNDLIKSHNRSNFHETNCKDKCKCETTLKLMCKSNEFDMDSIDSADSIKKRELLKKMEYLMRTYETTLREIERFIKNLYKNMNIDILNLVVKYEWFKSALRIHNVVPENDNNLIKLLEIKEIRKNFATNCYIFFDTIRRRRIRIIKYLWKYEKTSIKKLRNDKGEDILTYAKNCRGLMHNIISLFSR
jgi:hypothetical protein